MPQKLNDGSFFFTFPENIFEPEHPTNPQQLFLRVNVKGGRVVTDPRIEGEADLPAQGTPGWYELGARKFFPTQTAKSPASPFLEGFLTENGFVPSTRQVL